MHRWQPPTSLDKFHTWLLGRKIENYRHAQALHDIYAGKVRESSEMYFRKTNKQQHAYVAKNLALKYKQIKMKARETAKKNKRGWSRHPYGKNPSTCKGHGYPCTLAVEKRKGSHYFGRTYECCNGSFKSERDGGDNTRCGHKVFCDRHQASDCQRIKHARI